MDEPKFCKDCKHFTEASYAAGYSWPARCHQPPERDLVSGRKIPADPHRMRSEYGECRPAGWLWEEKPAPPPPAIAVQPVLGELADMGQKHAPYPREVIRPIEPGPRWWEFWK